MKDDPIKSICLYSSWSDYDDTDAYLEYSDGCLTYGYRNIWGSDVCYGGCENEEITTIIIDRKNTEKYISILGENFLDASRAKFGGSDINNKFRKFLDENGITYSIEKK